MGCQVWLENKITNLEKKRDGAGKFGKIFQAIIDKLTKCQVQWEQSNSPIVDDSYNTNEKIVASEDSYNTTEEIVASDDSYNTNEKIVNTDNPVTCGAPKAETKENVNLDLIEDEQPQPY